MIYQPDNEITFVYNSTFLTDTLTLDIYEFYAQYATQLSSNGLSVFLNVLYSEYVKPI